nr:2-dehydropantoate 2-reductase N-terminal domain-containing protein [Paraburkholderia youngii]
MAKICIYGAGSIGCYVGGRLLTGGSDPRVLGIPDALFERLGRAMLTILPDKERDTDTA